MKMTQQFKTELLAHKFQLNVCNLPADNIVNPSG